jgi:hypothetical protein
MDSTKVQKTGTMRKKHGGRQKGTPNKSTEYLFELCKQNDFDPIQGLIWVAQNDWKSLGYDTGEIERQGFQGIVVTESVISLEHRVDAMKTLTAYMYPKRKAIEMSVDKDSVPTVVLAYSKEGVKDAAKG